MTTIQINPSAETPVRVIVKERNVGQIFERTFRRARGLEKLAEDFQVLRSLGRRGRVTIVTHEDEKITMDWSKFVSAFS